jgi:hypothetical protein
VFRLPEPQGKQQSNVILKCALGLKPAVSLGSTAKFLQRRIIERILCFLCFVDRASLYNRLTPNDTYMGRTAPLTSKRCILYIYSTNIGTEYFKHGLYPPFFFSSKCSLFHNSNLFVSCIIHILYTQCAKIKKNNSGAKGIILQIKPNWCTLFLSALISFL